MFEYLALEKSQTLKHRILPLYIEFLEYHWLKEYRDFFCSLFHAFIVIHGGFQIFLDIVIHTVKNIHIPLKTCSASVTANRGYCH